ncbi:MULTISPECIES: pyocin S6 family toxin immunity protein [unclassified Pseudomonas]|uniref:pyocin S6 family toxin immunity protein n=1 Tax=unclassified Pseudomonas TaxID=196821 RepID=UPI00069D7A1C|nr:MULTISPECIES: pyocin S6 family toxin immunity protein [unclassified Pseudomonas]
MFLWISGFLKDDDYDDSLKYEFTVNQKSEPAVLAVLGWKNLDDSPDGEWLLTSDQVQQISEVIAEQLPMELDVFIGVRG